MGADNTTVLFAELPGFSGLSADLSSKELNSLLKGYYEITDSTVRMHHGQISSFSGDTLMAVFNSEKISGPQIRVLEAVSELRERVDTFFSEIKVKNSIGFKAGIASGKAIIGEIDSEGKKNITVMGEAVVNATRLREFAEAGQVLVGENIFNKAKETYRFQKLEPLPIRGTKETLHVYELLEKKRISLQPESFPERKIVSSLVGRNPEMETMESLLRQLAGGKGCIVNIVGKAGIGKSRLMAELRAQPIMQKMLLLEGRAIATGKQLSFHPIANLIRNWAGIREDDLPSVSAEKLEKSVQHIAPEKADEIFAFVAKMMGLPLTGKYAERVKGIEGEALEKLILKNLRDLIISATKDKPRVYMIEDMHWSDQSSINLFKSLYKLSLTHPVMFINVMRPGYPETGDYMLKYLAENFPEHHAIIRVDALGQTDSGQLITNLLRKAKLPKEIEEMIIHKTEGNPFFIEEVLRSFIDDGIIRFEGKKVIITEKIEGVNIPETINEAILSRVDKLDEKTRELLNTASVMGRNFYYKVLEEATDTIEELDERLAYMSEVQLITETKKKEEIEYLFKHALAQQLTYDAMLQQSRKEIHLKIARSIEKVFAVNIHEFYGTLVYHYKMAENEEKTIQYLILAGDESSKSGASAEALQYYQQAINLMPSERLQDVNDEDIMNLSIKVAVAKHSVGKNEEAVLDFEMLLKKHFNDRISENNFIVKVNGITSILVFMFMINNKSFFFRKKMYQRFDLYMSLVVLWGNALITYNPKAFAFKTAPRMVKMSNYNFWNSPASVSAFISGASLFNWTGLSFRTSQNILDLAQKEGLVQNSNSFITYQMMRQMQNYYTGNWNLSDNYTNVYETGIRLGKFWEVTIYMIYTGMICLETKDHKTFEDISGKFEELAETFDNSHARAQKIRFLALAYIKFRKFSNLSAIIDDGIFYIKTTGHEAMLLVVYCLKARLSKFLDNIEIAEETLIEAKKLVDKHNGVPVYYVQYLLAKANHSFKKLKITPKTTNDYNVILKELKKDSAKLITESKKMAGTIIEAYLLRGEIYQYLNKNSKAFKNFNLALRIGEKFNGHLELSRAYFETGKFLADTKNKYKELNGQPAEYYLEKAKTMFEEMDLQWDLEEYRKFTESLKTN